MPDAIHVGFSKCASTFLQALFQSHPDIYLVYKSHFFSPLHRNHFDKGLDFYASFFRGAGSAQVILESDEHIVLPMLHPVTDSRATTLSGVEETVARIARTVPHAKIILILRNQSDLIVSRYSQYLVGGGKLDFESYAAEQLACSVDGVNYYQNFYARIIGAFHDRFPSENLLVVLQEEIRKDKRAATGEIFRFLGVAEHCETPAGIRHQRAGLSYRGLQTIRFFNNLLVKHKQTFELPVRTYVPQSQYIALIRLIRLVDFYLPVRIKASKNRLFTDGMRHRLKQLFREDNRELSGLLARKIDRLGYSI